MLPSNLLLISLVLLSARAIPQSKTSEEPLWHADRPSPVAIYRDLECKPTTPGCFHFYYQAPAGASLAAHRHSVAMKITVRFGRKFILMGDLDSARVQRFDAGSTFTIPANTWHVEWWETETLEDVEGIGPMQTERASPETPRQDAAGNRR